MTQKEAKAVSLEVWQYLAEHPEKCSKYSIPKELLDKVRNFQFACPLCDLFYQNDCDGCPLHSCNGGSYFGVWSEFHNPKAKRQVAAQKIVAAIQAWEPEEA
jgi:hypothetical protein